MSEIDDIRERAEEGDVTAQAELALAYMEGVHVESNDDLARYWLLRAVDGGNPWAMVTYAIELRRSKLPDKLEESTALLRKAAESDYPLAHMTLGGHLILGIGTQVDVHEGVAELIMAVLGKDIDSINLLKGYEEAFGDDDWDRVYSYVRWPVLTIVMGPFVEGHLVGLNADRLQNGYDDQSAWFEYETELGNHLFGPNSPIVREIFGSDAVVSSVYVGRGIVNEELVSAISVNYGNVLIGRRRPQRPPDPAILKTLSDTIAVLEGRKWVRSLYRHS